MLHSVAEELTVAPPRSTGFVFLYPPNDPMIDGTIKLFTRARLRDKRHYALRIVFPTGGATARVNGPETSRTVPWHVSEIWKSFSKAGPLPCRGCVSVRTREPMSHSSGPFFPRTARSSFPPNPKGLRGRAMTKVHATDGKRSPLLLLIALRWPFRVVIGRQGIVAALLSVCTCPHVLITYESKWCLLYYAAALRTIGRKCSFSAGIR